MSKEVRWQLKDFVEPLAVLPYGFWAIYWYENGFDWMVGILGAVLFFVVLPIIVVVWDR